MEKTKARPLEVKMIIVRSRKREKENAESSDEIKE